MAKNFFTKRGWLCLLVAVLVLIGFGANADKVNSSSKITKATFDNIKISETDGSSKADVETLLGQKPTSTKNKTVNGMKVKECFWRGKGDGATVTAGFYKGTAISKTVTLPSSPKISASKYQSVQKGMNEDEVLKKLGTPSDLSATNINAYSIELLSYDVKNHGHTTNATITFDNGAVSGISELDK